MTIESDIVTACAGITKFYPAGEVPENTEPPLVTYRRTFYESPQLLGGGGCGLAHSEFTFECWGAKTEGVTSAKSASITLATSLRSALDASATLTAASRFEISNSGDKFEPELLEVMEPVFYSFWHAP